MKRIRLISLHLSDFKGTRNLDATFNQDGTTYVRGRNGTGKSTLFDAFTWVLFGKDSHGASNFAIKTQDETGEPIHKLTHSVECVLSVDGEELTIKRIYKEKWTKKRGNTEETFQGHEEERYINNVPYTLRDYTAKIEEIIPYNIFQQITNPRTFLALSTEEKRATLVEMAGVPTDKELADRLNAPRIAKLLEKKTLAEVIAERKANASKLRQDLKGMPQRIEEATLAIPEGGEDEMEIAERHRELQLQRANLNHRLETAEAGESEKGLQLLKIQGELMNLKTELRKTTAQMDALYTESWRKEKSEQEQAQRRIAQLEEGIPRMMAERAKDKHDFEEPTLARIEELRERFAEVSKRTHSVSITGLCPTCGAPYSSERMEELKEEAQAQFNARQARDKKEINREGKALKERLESVQQRMARVTENIHASQEELEQLQKHPLLSKDLGGEPQRPEQSEKEKRLLQEIEEKEKELEMKRAEGVSEATQQLRDERDAIEKAIEEIIIRKGNAQRATAQKARVAELEKMHQDLNLELAYAERDLNEIQEFERAKMELVEEKVNELFHTLRWRMYRDQVNGGKQEVCEPLINGVPHSDANTAAQINAGVDICRAIGAHQGVQAPIFIDNAEAANHIIRTEAQQIHLVVTTGEFEIVDR